MTKNKYKDNIYRWSVISNETRKPYHNIHTIIMNDGSYAQVAATFDFDEITSYTATVYDAANRRILHKKESTLKKAKALAADTLCQLIFHKLIDETTPPTPSTSGVFLNKLALTNQPC